MATTNRSSLVKHQLHHSVAKAFYTSLFTRANNTYTFFGRILPWTDDTIPVETSEYFLDEYDTRNNIVHMARVLPTDVCFVIKRNDWSYGAIYDKYDPLYSPEFKSSTSANSIYTARMFVLTPDMNIYKCIDNNSGAASTVMPTGTQSAGYITTADGYVWKYMASVSPLARQKFLSSAWVPVENTIGGAEEPFADSIVPKINASGNGYSPENTKISILGDGVGADLRPIIRVTNSVTITDSAGVPTVYTTGEIVGVRVENPGEGYTFANVVISCPNPNAPQGTGAQMTVSFPILDLNLTQVDVQLSATPGDISSIELLNGGNGYTTATATVVGDGTGAVIDVELKFGRIVKLNLVERGYGYTKADIVITGTGTGGAAKIIVSPRNGHGFDIVQEAMADTLAFYKDLTLESNAFIDTYAPYRQTGMVINPTVYPIFGEYPTRASDDTMTPCWHVGSISIAEADYTIGQTLLRQADKKQYNVVAKKTGALLLQSLENYDIAINDVMTDINGNIMFTVGELFRPSVDKFSGVIISYDNREPYRKVQDSTVIVRSYIQF